MEELVMSVTGNLSRPVLCSTYLLATPLVLSVSLGCRISHIGRRNLQEDAGGWPTARPYLYLGLQLPTPK